MKELIEEAFQALEDLRLKSMPTGFILIDYFDPMLKNNGNTLKRDMQLCLPSPEKRDMQPCLPLAEKRGI